MRHSKINVVRLSEGYRNHPIGEPDIPVGPVIPYVENLRAGTTEGTKVTLAKGIPDEIKSALGYGTISAVTLRSIAGSYLMKNHKYRRLVKYDIVSPGTDESIKTLDQWVRNIYGLKTDEVVPKRLRDIVAWVMTRMTSHSRPMKPEDRQKRQSELDRLSDDVTNNTNTADLNHLWNSSKTTTYFFPLMKWAIENAYELNDLTDGYTPITQLDGYCLVQIPNKTQRLELSKVLGIPFTSIGSDAIFKDAIGENFIDQWGVPAVMELLVRIVIMR